MLPHYTSPTANIFPYTIVHNPRDAFTVFHDILRSACYTDNPQVTRSALPNGSPRRFETTYTPADLSKELGLLTLEEAMIAWAGMSSEEKREHEDWADKELREFRLLFSGYVLDLEQKRRKRERYVKGKSAKAPRKRTARAVLGGSIDREREGGAEPTPKWTRRPGGGLRPRLRLGAAGV